jgi:hypothetical protein
MIATKSKEHLDAKAIIAITILTLLRWSRAEKARSVTGGPMS